MSFHQTPSVLESSPSDLIRLYKRYLKKLAGKKFVHRYTKTSLCKLVKAFYFVSCHRFTNRRTLRRTQICTSTLVHVCPYALLPVIEPDLTRLAQLVS